ncbi:lipopolysaccharide transport periplasmic protein LptA [Oceanicoccus sp. KOV_DT_Chl]|uniref:lipopolysaccharide transport periplasmic protein LptA n=1 Tax=Oceanicoccus sp. KOV_DT_Chl TaxID=1904639 RepID=UPI000C7A9231|nr:lipopolysaccharide transport periplasmic protein LptA [Oceanicoccus sp. KOV_DT_Chl]
MTQLILQLTTLSLIGFLVSLPTQALPEDSGQPINIEADRASQTTKKNIELTEYVGNVQIIQGSLKINGDHIIIRSENRQVISMEAKGNPVFFEQQSDPTKPPMKANASKLVYQLNKNLVVLSGNASINQNGNIVSGEKIEYNTSSEQVKARGSKKESTRVRMVLVPEPKPDNTDTPTTTAVETKATTEATTAPDYNQATHKDTDGSSEGQ